MSVVGNTRIDKQPRRTAVQVRLINCLWCSHALQFWWSIGRAHQHRHMRMIRFNHCGVKLHCCCPRRTQQYCGYPIVLANTQRSE
jgi:hypothetical protein